jgi:hypothetical protein
VSPVNVAYRRAITKALEYIQAHEEDNDALYSTKLHEVPTGATQYETDVQEELHRRRLENIRRRTKQALIEMDLDRTTQWNEVLFRRTLKSMQQPLPSPRSSFSSTEGRRGSFNSLPVSVSPPAGALLPQLPQQLSPTTANGSVAPAGGGSEDSTGATLMEFVIPVQRSHWIERLGPGKGVETPVRPREHDKYKIMPKRIYDKLMYVKRSAKIELDGAPA